MRFAGRLALGGDEGHAYGARGLVSCEPPGSSALVAQQIGNHRLPLGVWPYLNKLSHSLSHKQLFPQMAPIVGSRFSDRAHYNEFVENGSKSWVLMRRRLVLGVKNTQNLVAQRPREKGPHARGRGCANPSRSYRGLLPFSGPPHPSPLSLLRSLLLYILLLCSSSSYTCQSSMPILECTSHRSFFLALCELLWPLSRCPGVTSILMVSGC